MRENTAALEPQAKKRMRGKTSYLAGAAAEDIVARAYTRGGFPILEKRWRGSRGEIDLVAQDGDAIIFIEVKKSSNHAQAAAHLTRRQMDRIYGTGTEFLATQPKGQLTDVRFDVALVDDHGRVSVIENVFIDS